jgi:predicted HAD superfamily Cof-like phosphohydrolase
MDETTLVDRLMAGEEVSYEFKIEQAGDVVRMLIKSGKGAVKSGQSEAARAIVAQAEMIMQELHVEPRAPDIMKDVVAFHEQFGLAYQGKPRDLRTEVEANGSTLYEFRLGFMREEINEYEDEQEALTIARLAGDEDEVTLRLHKQLDALVDAVYVIVGTAYLQFGKDVWNKAWDRVQAANMAKVRTERPEDSKRGSGFDVVKPAGWVEPDHRPDLKDHAHVIFRAPGELNKDHAHDTQVIPTAQ